MNYVEHQLGQGRVFVVSRSVKLYHVSRSCGPSDLGHIPDHTKLVSPCTCFIHVPIPVSCTSDLTCVSCIGPYP